MAGFFESIISGKAGGHLMTAWITGGENAGARVLFGRDGLIYRDSRFPEEAADGLQTRAANDGSGELTAPDGSRIFLERVSEGKRLVICGAGHVALCVIRLGVMLGYDVTVIEDREEYAAKARAAGAGLVICKAFGEGLAEIGEDPGTAYVIMTREHSHDAECLRSILRKPYAYAGMMGSRSRTEIIRRQMLEEGFDARKVEELHMPIGLPINSRTPEEIAVSVAAELISVLNARNPEEGFPPGMAEELAGLEKAGKAQDVLALIVEKNGEAPRRPGTKMLIRRDGSFLGTVGGGYAEAEILRTARDMIAEGNRECRLMRVSMKKGAMHCGGEITVLMTVV